MQSRINEHGIKYLPELDKHFAELGIAVTWRAEDGRKYSYNMEWKDHCPNLYFFPGLELCETAEEIADHMLRVRPPGYGLGILLHGNMLYYDFIEQ